MNVAYCDGRLVLPLLQPGHKFFVTSILMEIVTVRGLFLGRLSVNPDAHIDKLRSLCQSFVGRLDMDINVIGLRVFPLSLTKDVAIWLI